MNHFLRCLGVLLLGPVLAGAQIITCEPAEFTADDTVTITYDARLGNGALAGQEGPVYLHSGLITGTVFEPSGWRFVQGKWGEDDPRVRMEPIGSDRHRIRLHPRSFYGLPEDEELLQLAFVFRDASGTIVGKSADEGDIFYPELDKFPNGPLERADGRDGRFLGALRGRPERLPSGAVSFSDGRGRLLVRRYPGGVLNLVFLPTGATEVPPSEALLPEAQALPLPMPEVAGRAYRFPGAAQGASLEVEPAPIRFALNSEERSLLEAAGGFFFDTSDTLIGPVTGIRLKLKPGERLYGGGSRATPLDKRGQRFYHYTTANYGYTYGEAALNVSIPFLLSSEGYGILFDSYRRGYLDMGHTESDVLEAGVKDTLLSVFLIPGNDPPEILRTFTELVGRQPLPPRWALGYIQSRFGYRTQEEALNITRRTLDAGFPLDAILIDLYWFGDRDRMGDWAWQPRQWPDPEGMIRRLADWGVQTILISESYFIRDTRLWDELVDRELLARQADGSPFVIPDFWAGPAGLLDVFKPEARAWFWPLYRKQTLKGLAGWWCDSGEPENHPAGMMHVNGSAEEVHNLYGNYWSRILWEGYRKDFPRQRLFNLNRSGTTGMQRYAVFPWSGDVSRSWDAYRAQLPIMLGMGMSGVPFMHSDLGGFTGGPRDEELYTRWLQLGTFTPIMRVHGDALGIMPEPIFYPDSVQTRVKEAIALRYRLLPYNYTLTWEAHLQGRPLARPMAFHFPADTALAGREDQYLWGEHLLVAPVLEKGADLRLLQLPEGYWYDYYRGGRPLPGGMPVVQPGPADRIPLLVRAGSWLPEYAGSGNAGRWFNDSIAWKLFLPVGEGLVKGRCYVDDGHTPGAYEKEEYALLAPEAEVDARRIQIRMAIQMGSRASSDLLPAPAWSSLEVYGLAEAPRSIQLGGKALPAGNWNWDAGRHILHIRPRGSDLEATITIKR